MQIKLLSLSDVTEDLQSQVTELYLQLNSELKQCSLKKILIKPEAIEIVVCIAEHSLVGIAMMAKYTVISGQKGMIEDVVVSNNYRGKGIGRKLIELLLLRANECMLDDVLLFSGHHRTAAIALYKSLGFTLKNSGLYVKKMAS